MPSTPCQPRKMNQPYVASRSSLRGRSFLCGGMMGVLINTARWTGIGQAWMYVWPAWLRLSFRKWKRLSVDEMKEWIWIQTKRGGRINGILESGGGKAVLLFLPRCLWRLRVGRGGLALWVCKLSVVWCFTQTRLKFLCRVGLNMTNHIGRPKKNVTDGVDATLE